MKVYIKAFIITALVGAGFIWAYGKWREKATATDGEKQIVAIESMETAGVPGFESKNLDGQVVKLADFRGKTVIINFWASWCGPCLEEFPSLISLVEKFGGDIQVIAVSGDNSREDIDAFLKAFPKIKNHSIHLVWDEDRSLTKAYSVDRLPESFVVDKNLKLAKKIIGTINWHTPDSEEFMKALIAK